MSEAVGVEVLGAADVQRQPVREAHERPPASPCELGELRVADNSLQVPSQMVALSTTRAHKEVE
ncbi:hypothetical protein ACU4GG_38830 [Streptomyces nojiriensis]